VFTKRVSIPIVEAVKESFPIAVLDQFLRQAEREVAAKDGIGSRGDEIAKGGQRRATIGRAARKVGGTPAADDGQALCGRFCFGEPDQVSGFGGATEVDTEYPPRRHARP
jgi:hypothetical protein